MKNPAFGRLFCFQDLPIFNIVRVRRLAGRELLKYMASRLRIPPLEE